MDKMPIVTLTNGVNVGNFSSPHPFTFIDGTELPKCSKKRSLALSMVIKETPSIMEELSHKAEITKVKISVELTKEMNDELYRLQRDDSVDLIIVPLCVRQAIDAEEDKNETIMYPKAVVIRYADRINKLAEIDKFC